MATYWLTALAIFILILLSAFFSGSETALTAASRARMLQLEKKGNRRAWLVGRLMLMRERLIGSILSGNNLVNLFTSALATSLFLSLFGEVGVVYATFVMTLLILIFAEILPKSLALSQPDRFALWVAYPISGLVKILAPVVNIINAVVGLVLRRAGIGAQGEGNSSLSVHDELRGAVDLQHLEGGLGKSVRDHLGGVLDLHDMAVEDVMVHRTNMEALNLDETPEDLVEKALNSPYTRLPIWKDNPENIVGILHAKDLLRRLKQVEWDVRKLDFLKTASSPWFVSENTSLQDQLNAFLRRHEHMALVIDEYGEVMGLVTLEDILEEIVGEIADELDENIQGIHSQADGSLLVEGSVSVRDLNRATDWNLPDENATTVAGLILHEAQMIPEEKQAFNFHGCRFLVLKRDKNRIAQLRITPLVKSTTTSRR